MIAQRNAREKIHTKIMWCPTPEGQEEVELVTLNSRQEGGGGWGCWRGERGGKQKNQHANLKFWSKKILKEIEKEHCIWIPFAISV